MLSLGKKKFIILTIAVLIFNCVMFTLGGMAAFRAGDGGVENQAALILIPAFLVPAAWVVTAVLAALILIVGLAAKMSAIDPAEIFKMSGLGVFAKIFRAGYLAFALFLMLFGFLLLTPEWLSAGLYALSGGALLVLLFSLVRAAARGEA